MKMHEGEVTIDDALVTRLVAAQFPHLSGLPIRAATARGTVNAIFRIGDDLCARLPRLYSGVRALEKEAAWLPWLAPRLPLPVPELVGSGKASSDYPMPWAIYRWITGEPYRDESIDDELRAAKDLARFVHELRHLDTAEAPQAGRRPLSVLDTVTRNAIAEARDLIDSDAVAAAWQHALAAPPWSGTPVWIHADLLRPNVLVEHDRISAIIDFGSAGVGDPAHDVIPAWSVFGPAGRDAYRRALDVDDDTWARARGYALHQAALIVPYYAKTNPPFTAQAQRTITQVLAEVDSERGATPL
jgi:aminoglycoside phosphotransferase (APT) family kinase protein